MTVAESRIRDTDMAEQITAYTTENIILQSSNSMMVHANSLAGPGDSAAPGIIRLQGLIWIYSRKFERKIIETLIYIWNLTIFRM